MTVSAASVTTLPAESSAATLSRPARHPRFSFRRRPAGFYTSFEDRALFYDCFWHHDGQRVLLVGPPPVNLHYRRIAFEAGGVPLAARFHTSFSVTLTELNGVPPDAREISVGFAGETFALPIRDSHCAALAGRRLIFAINKNNDLRWIREWAHWHARHHGADAVILFDNGSSGYATSDVAATLAATPGIATVAVHSWPQKFGPIDPGVINNPYWSRFLQIGSMSVVLRRYGMLAHGLLDCDIDELAAPLPGGSIYDLARASRGGLVVFRGRWVEALAEPGSAPGAPHRAYRHVLADERQAESSNRKWALDPSRDWVQHLKVHPYWHWIEGRPRGSKTVTDEASYWHFRAVSTNWKRPPAVAPETGLRREPALDRDFGVLAE